MSLETAGAHLYGVVVNKIARQEANTYVYDGGYEPAVAVDSTTAVAPKRARPEPPMQDASINGSSANGSVYEKAHRNREATPAPR